MKSMTGYGTCQNENERCRMAVSIRSQNHRNLDLVMRLKDRAVALEPALREQVTSRLSRGRVEVTVDLVWLEPPPVELALKTGVVDEVERLMGRLEGHDWIRREISLGELLRIPGLVESRAIEADISSADESLMIETFETALDGLLEMRQREGEKLRAVVADCMSSLDAVGHAISARRQETVGALQEELVKRVRALLAEAGLVGDSEPDAQGPTAELDSARLVQEVAFLVERSDIREELDRLDSHLIQIRGLLESAEPIGRRLDFLSQEILRELNTIGSKCRDAATTSLVVDGKVICDQFREQAQNIE